MIEKAAICQVQSYTELQSKLEGLLENKRQRQQLEKNTATLTHDTEEVLQRYTQLIEKQC